MPNPLTIHTNTRDPFARPKGVTAADDKAANRLLEKAVRDARAALAEGGNPQAILDVGVMGAAVLLGEVK